VLKEKRKKKQSKPLQEGGKQRILSKLRQPSREGLRGERRYKRSGVISARAMKE